LASAISALTGLPSEPIRTALEIATRPAVHYLEKIYSEVSKARRRSGETPSPSLSTSTSPVFIPWRRRLVRWVKAGFYPTIGVAMSTEHEKLKLYQLTAPTPVGTTTTFAPLTTQSPESAQPATPSAPLAPPDVYARKYKDIIDKLNRARKLAYELYIAGLISKAKYENIVKAINRYEKAIALKPNAKIKVILPNNKTIEEPVYLYVSQNADLILQALQAYTQNTQFIHDIDTEIKKVKQWIKKYGPTGAYVTIMYKGHPVKMTLIDYLNYLQKVKEKALEYNKKLLSFLGYFPKDANSLYTYVSGLVNLQTSNANETIKKLQNIFMTQWTPEKAIGYLQYVNQLYNLFEKNPEKAMQLFGNKWQQVWKWVKTVRTALLQYLNANAYYWEKFGENVRKKLESLPPIVRQIVAGFIGYGIPVTQGINMISQYFFHTKVFNLPSTAEQWKWFMKGLGSEAVPVAIGTSVGVGVYGWVGEVPSLLSYIIPWLKESPLVKGSELFEKSVEYVAHYKNPYATPIEIGIGLIPLGPEIVRGFGFGLAKLGESLFETAPELATAIGRTGLRLIRWGEEASIISRALSPESYLIEKALGLAGRVGRRIAFRLLEVPIEGEEPLEVTVKAITPLKEGETPRLWKITIRGVNPEEVKTGLETAGINAKVVVNPENPNEVSILVHSEVKPEVEVREGKTIIKVGGKEITLPAKPPTWTIEETGEGAVKIKFRGAKTLPAVEAPGVKTYTEGEWKVIEINRPSKFEISPPEGGKVTVKIYVPRSTRLYSLYERTVKRIYNLVMERVVRPIMDRLKIHVGYTVDLYVEPVGKGEYVVRVRLVPTPMPERWAEATRPRMPLFDMVFLVDRNDRLIPLPVHPLGTLVKVEGNIEELYKLLRLGKYRTLLARTIFGEVVPGTEGLKYIVETVGTLETPRLVEQLEKTYGPLLREPLDWLHVRLESPLTGEELKITAEGVARSIEAPLHPAIKLRPGETVRLTIHPEGAMLEMTRTTNQVTLLDLEQYGYDFLSGLYSKLRVPRGSKRLVKEFLENPELVARRYLEYLVEKGAIDRTVMEKVLESLHLKGLKLTPSEVVNMVNLKIIDVLGRPETLNVSIVLNEEGLQKLLKITGGRGYTIEDMIRTLAKRSVEAALHGETEIALPREIELSERGEKVLSLLHQVKTIQDLENAIRELQLPQAVRNAILDMARNEIGNQLLHLYTIGLERFGSEPIEQALRDYLELVARRGLVAKSDIDTIVRLVMEAKPKTVAEAFDLADRLILERFGIVPRNFMNRVIRVVIYFPDIEKSLFEAVEKVVDYLKSFGLNIDLEKLVRGDMEWIVQNLLSRGRIDLEELLEREFRRVYIKALPSEKTILDIVVEKFGDLVRKPLKELLEGCPYKSPILEARWLVDNKLRDMIELVHGELKKLGIDIPLEDIRAIFVQRLIETLSREGWETVPLEAILDRAFRDIELDVALRIGKPVFYSFQPMYLRGELIVRESGAIYRALTDETKLADIIARAGKTPNDIDGIFKIVNRYFEARYGVSIDELIDYALQLGGVKLSPSYRDFLEKLAKWAVAVAYAEGGTVSDIVKLILEGLEYAGYLRPATVMELEAMIRTALTRGGRQGLPELIVRIGGKESGVIRLVAPLGVVRRIEEMEDIMTRVLAKYGLKLTDTVQEAIDKIGLENLEKLVEDYLILSFYSPRAVEEGTKLALETVMHNPEVFSIRELLELAEDYAREEANKLAEIWLKIVRGEADKYVEVVQSIKARLEDYLKVAKSWIEEGEVLPILEEARYMNLITEEQYMNVYRLLAEGATRRARELLLDYLKSNIEKIEEEAEEYLKWLYQNWRKTLGEIEKAGELDKLRKSAYYYYVYVRGLSPQDAEKLIETILNANRDAEIGDILLEALTSERRILPTEMKARIAYRSLLREETESGEEMIRMGTGESAEEHRTGLGEVVLFRRGAKTEDEVQMIKDIRETIREELRDIEDILKDIFGDHYIDLLYDLPFAYYKYLKETPLYLALQDIYRDRALLRLQELILTALRISLRKWKNSNTLRRALKEKGLKTWLREKLLEEYRRDFITQLGKEILKEIEKDIDIEKWREKVLHPELKEIKRVKKKIGGKWRWKSIVREEPIARLFSDVMRKDLNAVISDLRELFRAIWETFGSVQGLKLIEKLMKDIGLAEELEKAWSRAVAEGTIPRTREEWDMFFKSVVEAWMLDMLRKLAWKKPVVETGTKVALGTERMLKQLRKPSSEVRFREKGLEIQGVKPEEEVRTKTFIFQIEHEAPTLKEETVNITQTFQQPSTIQLTTPKQLPTFKLPPPSGGLPPFNWPYWPGGGGGGGGGIPPSELPFWGPLLNAFMLWLLGSPAYLRDLIELEIVVL